MLTFIVCLESPVRHSVAFCQKKREREGRDTGSGGSCRLDILRELRRLLLHDLGTRRELDRIQLRISRAVRLGTGPPSVELLEIDGSATV